MMKGLRKQRRRIHPMVAVIIALFAAGLMFAGYSIIHGLLEDRAETRQEALADCRSAQQRFSTTYTTYQATMSSAQRLAETWESDVANPASVSDLAGTIAPMPGPSPPRSSTGRSPVRSWLCMTDTGPPSRRFRAWCRDCATRG